MSIRNAATSFCPSVIPLNPGYFRGRTIRHTLRVSGTKDWLLICTLKGSGLYQFPGGSFTSRPRDITLFRPGAFQDYQRSPDAEQWDLLYAHFLPRSEWLPWLHWPELAPGLMALSPGASSLQNRIALRLKEIVRFHYSSEPRRENLGLNALEEIFLWCDSINPRQAGSQIDSRVLKAMDYLCSHFAEPFDEEKMAREAALSPSRLRHLFQTQTGTSPRDFLEEQRMRRAMELLSLSRQTIAGIANATGFENPFYFTLRFKKHTGESPSDFRRRISLPPAPERKH